MAAEAPPPSSSSSSSSAARPPPAGAASPETYLGSVISLTSKSEIRYEGVLYNINTEESSIGLRNVRSFGTEGRKKEGIQIPGSDKVYEYILFRGTDIKDLQVKSSPPQPAPLHNDPAIIQSHYPQPASTSTSLPTAGAASKNLNSLVSSKTAVNPSATLSYQTVSQAISSTVASPSPAGLEMPAPLMASSGQLLQNAPSMLSSSQSMQTPLQMSNNIVKPADPKTRVAEPLLPDPLTRAVPENNEPILPLPKQTPQKYNGASSQSHHNFRGRGRGRGSALSQSVTKFTEEFDFMAMNEKFNKDEVWGHLGKKSQSRDKDSDLGDDVFDEDLEYEETDNPELDVKPVYVKDDFFDSLSGGTFGRGGQNGRPRFSELRKMDTETFGDFPRHRQPYRGGGRGYRGGGRSRGSYYGGRDYGNMGGGRDYGNMGRGGGQENYYGGRGGYGNTGRGGQENYYGGGGRGGYGRGGHEDSYPQRGSYGRG
uniref:Uncharacterized protein n=1 Tax=Avena sativa TaxID=4498 RepID=A0ACD5TSA8_AVESA